MVKHQHLGHGFTLPVFPRPGRDGPFVLAATACTARRSHSPRPAALPAEKGRRKTRPQFESLLRATSERLADVSGYARWLLAHVSRKCSAVSGQRYASNQRTKACRMDPVSRDKLWLIPSDLTDPRWRARRARGYWPAQMLNLEVSESILSAQKS